METKLNPFPTIIVSGTEKDASVSVLNEADGTIVVGVVNNSYDHEYTAETQLSADDAGRVVLDLLARGAAPDKGALLGRLIDLGVDLSTCIKAFSERQSDEAKAYVELARDKWVQEGAIEIDDFSIASGSEDKGDYVLAWVWVDGPDEDEEEHDDNDDCAKYDTGYQVHWNEDLSTTKDVEDLEVGETYNDPASDPADKWWPVMAVETVDDQVHVDSTEVE